MVRYLDNLPMSCVGAGLASPMYRHNISPPEKWIGWYENETKVCYNCVMSGKVSPVAFEFYDVKARKRVKLSEKDIVKGIFSGSDGRIHYGVRGRTSDGRILTKFIDKADWESLNVAQEKIRAH
jgi:hypothetical protein